MTHWRRDEVLKLLAMNSSCQLNETMTTEKGLSPIKVILISLYVLTAAFHMVGVAVLVRIRSKLNQTLIIINLAVTEIIACLNFAALSIFEGIPYLSLEVFSALAMRIFMLTLLADRFLEIYLNIMYPVNITRDRIYKLSFLIWTVSAGYGIALAVFAAFGGCSWTALSRAFYIHNYTIGVLDLIFTISAIFTYSYFHFKIREITSIESARGRSETRTVGHVRTFNY